MKTFTYNITFVTSSDMEERLLSYLRDSLVPVLFKEGSLGCHPELKKVIEAGGENPGEDRGVSLALSAIFPSEDAARLWHQNTLMPSLGSFASTFGMNALFFITLLENIPI